MEIKQLLKDVYKGVFGAWKFSETFNVNDIDELTKAWQYVDVTIVADDYNWTFDATTVDAAFETKFNLAWAIHFATANDVTGKANGTYVVWAKLAPTTNVITASAFPSVSADEDITVRVFYTAK